MATPYARYQAKLKEAREKQAGQPLKAQQQPIWPAYQASVSTNVPGTIRHRSSGAAPGMNEHMSNMPNSNLGAANFKSVQASKPTIERSRAQTTDAATLLAQRKKQEQSETQDYSLGNPAQVSSGPAMGNAMSSKTRKRVEEKYQASSFSRFSDLSGNAQQKEDRNRAEMKNLFYNPANRNMNRTYNPWGRGNQRWQKKGNDRNSGRQSGEYGERILQMERVEKQKLALVTQGFFDPNLKDIIKAFESSRFDAERKAWIIPIDQKDEMIEAISQHCLENNILIGEQPKFVDTILNTPIPFSGLSKAARELNFNY